MHIHTHKGNCLLPLLSLHHYFLITYILKLQFILHILTHLNTDYKDKTGNIKLFNTADAF
jgi:hypothetical protein